MDPAGVPILLVVVGVLVTIILAENVYPGVTTRRQKVYIILSLVVLVASAIWLSILALQSLYGTSFWRCTAGKVWMILMPIGIMIGYVILLCGYSTCKSTNPPDY